MPEAAPGVLALVLVLVSMVQGDCPPDPNADESNCPEPALRDCSIPLHAIACPVSCATCGPTVSPSVVPSSLPTTSPTVDPTGVPTHLPTASPNSPTSSPTYSPSFTPTTAPSMAPTAWPTTLPTDMPTTTAPTNAPSIAPTDTPTMSPTMSPTMLSPKQSGFCGSLAEYSCSGGSAAFILFVGVVVLMLVYALIWRRFRGTSSTTGSETTRPLGHLDLLGYDRTTIMTPPGYFDPVDSPAPTHYYPTGSLAFAMQPKTLAEVQSGTKKDFEITNATKVDETMEARKKSLTSSSPTGHRVDTRHTSLLLLSREDYVRLRVTYLCKHGAGVFIAEFDGEYAADQKIGLRWGMELIALGSKNVYGMNQSLLEHELNQCREQVPLTVGTHTYPSIVAVLPPIRSAADKHTLQMTMTSVSLEFKARAIPLSVVPLSLPYARHFPNGLLEKFMSQGNPALFNDWDYCGDANAFLQYLSPRGKLNRFLRLGERRRNEHTVPVERGPHGFGFSLECAVGSSLASPTDAMIIGDIRDGAPSSNTELFIGWQVLAMDGTPVCRANAQALMRSAGNRIMLTLRPNDPISSKAAAALTKAAQQLTQASELHRMSEASSAPTRPAFGRPLSQIFSAPGSSQTYAQAQPMQITNTTVAETHFTSDDNGVSREPMLDSEYVSGNVQHVIYTEPTDISLPRSDDTLRSNEPRLERPELVSESEYDSESQPVAETVANASITQITPITSVSKGHATEDEQWAAEVNAEKNKERAEALEFDFTFENTSKTEGSDGASQLASAGDELLAAVEAEAHLEDAYKKRKERMASERRERERIALELVANLSNGGKSSADGVRTENTNADDSDSSDDLDSHPARMPVSGILVRPPTNKLPMGAVSQGFSRDHASGEEDEDTESDYSDY